MPAPTASQILDRQYLHMRARILSLAADLDRIQRAPDYSPTHPRLTELHSALQLLLTTPTPTRAQQVQLLLSEV